MKHALMTLLGAAMLTGPALAQDQDLLIGSTSASSSHYGYFVAVGQLINENAEGLNASVVETGATMDNIRRMARGQVDLGLVTTNTAQHATSGTNAFDGKPQDLRLLWVYTNAPQNVVVRADAGVETLEDLAGVRFNPGIKGSSTEATTEAVFDTLGLAADYVRGSTTDIVGAIKDNRVAGYVKSGSGQKLDGSTMDIATSVDIGVIGLSAEQADKLRKEMPDISVVDIPAGAAEGIPAYTTWSFGVGVAAPASLDDETAYKIVSAIMADEKAQANAMASLKDADLAQMTLDYATIPLHPGAVRWFEENGHKVPEKLTPGN
ncbi:TAXI family TRAP transporter solute-binding subunit [Roseibium salinum]|uniref:TAXI family TRAP transporter solute-binding subunit n=1 Tax=Roseibium salinum TaxID=1604349 RepID=A0ABT3QWD8_9HYPH|nr:TAXI family TRAP transporter solute-binding subunit [Roseibium sp. DSM 29163]MCW1404445.1 TAXI family TRAP transporter solute-binding subunit [Novosphingobium sp. MW5]MCX2721244.1 TAXI family TRAP transporter solute-binding subunit [Roseibium sp. DSM 29163]MDN3722706.1 TAXI family TRAP transporter solute-binding subunit [Roseibium salinum]